MHKDSARWKAYYLYRKGLNPNYKVHKPAPVPRDARQWWTRLKYRCKVRGIPFNLEPSDMVYPVTCPIFGTTLCRSTKHPGPNSPSMDRINPSLGYIKGNIIIISQRANIMKSDGTWQELMQVAEFYKNRVSPLQ